MTTIQNTRRRLVVFDVEGVLMPKKRYLLFEVGRNLSFPAFVKIIFFGLLYEAGLISLKSAFIHVFRVFKGVRVDELLRIFRQVPLMPGVEEVFEQLKKEDIKAALISSGLPTVVVKDLGQRFQADNAFGFELELENETLTGKIWGDVIERNGKLSVLKKILDAEKLTPKDCVVVADDRNNAPIFLPEILKIGFDPDFVISMKADIAVTGELREILPWIKGTPKKRGASPSKNEVVREIIHACGFFVPILSLYFGQYQVALLITIVTLLYVMSELARIEQNNLPVISSITRQAATQTELYEFTTAPLFFALGILLTLLLFPFPANSAAIAIFALGDSTATIVGRTFGKHTVPFNKVKTLEGSTIGFVCAFLAGAFYITPLKALVGAALAMVVECLPLPLNDNLVVPLVTGAALMLLL